MIGTIASILKETSALDLPYSDNHVNPCAKPKP